MEDDGVVRTVVYNRLNHKPFIYHVTVTNSHNDTVPAMARLFIIPTEFVPPDDMDITQVATLDTVSNKEGVGSNFGMWFSWAQSTP